MTPAKRSSRRDAKTGTAKVGSGFCQGWQSISAIALKLRTIFPVKTALEVMLRTDVSERTAHRWLAGEAEISAVALVDLLRSDIGRTVLDELMAGASAPWWREFNRQLELAELARMQAAMQRDADANRERLLRALAGGA